ncbi:MAG TPA: tryptophan synthase subunit alpha [Polyangiaceae bacterium]|nr:tryptophan synthase subunit alpha [Polyangiaceae bacterium]
MLEQYLKNRAATRDILLMTHVVMGYPSFEASLEIVESMVEAGVDLMELQIPFSEPVADGPVILHANQRALEAGATVERCMKFAEQVTRRFEIPFLFMSYYNILYQHGVSRFMQRSRELGIAGAIVPDLPPEEGVEYLRAAEQSGVSPVFIFTPNTTRERLEYLGKHARGLVYCVARRGVTGSDTEFSRELGDYLERCRKATSLPLAVGFGVKTREDVEFLKGKAEIAVIGSQTIRLVEERGVSAVGGFIRSLR